jgi:hypothetical protein
MVSSLFAGIRSSRSLIRKVVMPELLTRRGNADPPAGWPASDRKLGRLQSGILAGFRSEDRPASVRNSRPASVGICKHDAGLLKSGLTILPQSAGEAFLHAAQRDAGSGIAVVTGGSEILISLETLLPVPLLG